MRDKHDDDSLELDEDEDIELYDDDLDNDEDEQKDEDLSLDDETEGDFDITDEELEDDETFDDEVETEGGAEAHTDTPFRSTLIGDESPSQPELAAPTSSAPPIFVPSSSTAPKPLKQSAPRVRLRDTAEKIVYFFALLVGGTVILVGKSAGWLAPWPAAIFAVACILVYASFAWMAQRENPVRADRLGDNSYYLGLVYTLASLIASLIMVNQGAEVNQLIGNFGVALVSTAAGIVARLVLIQLRAETDDVDQRARVALAETANTMQSDLLLAASVFRGLMIEAQESFRVSVERTRSSVEQSAELAMRLQNIELSPELVNNSLLSAMRSIEQAAEAISAAGENIRLQSNAISETASAVERTDIGLAKVHDVLGKLATTLEEHRRATLQVIAAMEQQSDQSEQFTRRLEKNAEEARLATQKVYGALGDLSNSIVSKLQR